MKKFDCAKQDGLTGSAWGDWANYTASPLRAFENELGVQAGTVKGFCDATRFLLYLFLCRIKNQKGRREF